jgi:hypothetical protein
MTNPVVTVKVELNGQFFEDMIVTAFEGGSNYWVDHVQINHPAGEKMKGEPVSTWAASALNLGGSVVFFIREEGDSHDYPPVTMTKEMLVSGVQMWLDNHKTPSEAIENYDIDDADAILQYSLFKELVFG